MESIHALSLSPAVNHWLANSDQPRILHLFDHACNLINEHGNVLSIVTPQIGNGPFNLVTKSDFLFVKHLNLDAPINIRGSCLQLGTLTINTAGAQLWHPRPDWNRLHTQRKNIFHQLTQFQISNYSSLQSAALSLSKRPVSTSPFSNSLLSSLSSANIPSAETCASQLAGLGPGLTPSGDDFIMGALYAVWIMYPTETAITLARAVADTAVPLTTSLSAAWLRAAGRGEAGVLWHNFLEALLLEYAKQIPRAMEQILAVGATSGADALSGFINTILYDRLKVQHG